MVDHSERRPSRIGRWAKFRWPGRLPIDPDQDRNQRTIGRLVGAGARHGHIHTVNGGAPRTATRNEPGPSTDSRPGEWPRPDAEPTTVGRLWTVTRDTHPRRAQRWSPGFAGATPYEPHDEPHDRLRLAECTTNPWPPSRACARPARVVGTQARSDAHRGH